MSESSLVGHARAKMNGVGSVARAASKLAAALRGASARHARTACTLVPRTLRRWLCVHGGHFVLTLSERERRQLRDDRLRVGAKEAR